MPGVPERKAEIIPYSNFMNLNAPDQDNACEGRWKILLCVFICTCSKNKSSWQATSVERGRDPFEQYRYTQHKYYPW